MTTIQRTITTMLVVAAGATACVRVEAAGTDESARVEGNHLIVSPGSLQRTGLSTIVVGVATADSLEVPGRIVWDEDATVRVFPPFAGRVVSIRADAGLAMRSGDTLALIASPDFGQAVADARRAATDLALTERTVARTHDLFAHGVVARKDLEAADADLARAHTERQRAWARVTPYSSDTMPVDQVFALRSPLAGLVVERNITPGQEVRPDQMLANTPQLVAPLFVVSDPSRLWVSLDLPERDVLSVRSGTMIHVRTASLGTRTFSGRVTWVANAIDPVTRTVKARAAIANPDGALRAEMLASAFVALPARHGVALPSTAVVFQGGMHIVFVDEGGGRLRRCTVTTAGEHDGVVAVDHGLAVGDRVVTSDVMLLEQLFQTTGKS